MFKSHPKTTAFISLKGYLEYFSDLHFLSQHQQLSQNVTIGNYPV